MEQNLMQEKKLALAQLVRQESMENQMRMRQREQIFYEPYSDIQPSAGMCCSAPVEETNFKGFRLRMTLALLLFTGFLFYDSFGQESAGMKTQELQFMIAEDSFGLCPDGENFAALPGLQALLDFEK